MTTSDEEHDPVNPILQAPSVPFPVTWADAADGDEPWVRDPVHFPEPLLAADYAGARAWVRGFDRAMAALGLPLRMKVARVNGTVYQVLGPLPLPPEELAARHAAAGPRVQEVVLGLQALWTGEVLPGTRAELAALDALPFHDRSGAALADAVDEAEQRLERLGELHFSIDIPQLVALSLYHDLWEQLFGPDRALEAYALLVGQRNLSTEKDTALWRVAVLARREPEVLRVLLDAADDEVVPRLRALPAGAAFVRALDRWLQDHGRRGARPFEVSRPSWREDPTPIVPLLRDFAQRRELDLEVEQARADCSRVAAVDAARAALAGHPAEARQAFEALLDAAQAAIVLHEDHNYWLDYRPFEAVRPLVLAAGRRLAADGVLAEEADAMHLELGELAEALRGRLDASALVAARVDELERYADVEPPPFLGSPPVAPPSLDDPVVRLAMRYSGHPPASAAADEVTGNAGSAGGARGTARVLCSLDDAARLQAGDVLVTATTMPPWTPLFARAAAVVTDTGGVLSHGAVVAREYGIPAVVGTGRGTVAIPDGALVEVDGDAGVVRILGFND